MATTIKGKLPCPDCGSIEEVKHDGRKYFIHCTACRTYTHYQTKEAQTRLQARLDALMAFYKTTLEADARKIKEAAEAEARPKNKPKQRLYKPVQINTVIDRLINEY